jgi:hypothetical protein
MTDGAPTLSISSARWIILIGLCATAAGVLSYFQLERHSFVSTSDFEFLVLEHMFLPALLLGLVTTLMGSALWARRAMIRDVAAYGIGIVILAPLALTLIPINIHGWTAAFMLVGADAILIGGLFLIFAAIRTVNQRRDRAGPG